MCWFQNMYHFWKLMNFYGSYERLKILISTFSLPCLIESDARLLSRHAQDQGRGRGRGRLYWVIFFSQTVNCCMIWIKKKSRRYLYFSLSERHLKEVRIYLPHTVHIFKICVAHVLCFFLQEMQWKCRCYERALGHAHRRRHRRHGQVVQV